MELGNRIKAGIALLGLLVPVFSATPASAAPQGPQSEYVIATSVEQHSGVLETLRASGSTILNSSADSGLIRTLTTANLAETLDNLSGVTVGRNRTYSINGSIYKPANPSLDRIDQRGYPGDDRYSFSDKQLGAGVDIYIVDGGVQGNHPQFSGRVKPGVSFVNTVASNGAGPGNTDCGGHGTHVAGIAAGETVGVAPKATIIPVQVFGCDSDAPAETYRIVSAMDWIVDHHKSGTPAVVNLSLGGENDPLLIEAINEAIADGLTVVVAAGNSTKDACGFSPANAPSAITVGAMSSSTGKDSISYFSNYGSCVDIFAPGGDFDPATGRTVTPILSANAAVLTPRAGPLNSDLREMVGTSQASPFVAGAAARYLSYNPSATPEEVTQVLLSSATPDVFADPKGSPNRLLFIDPSGYKKPTSSAPSTPTGVNATYVSDASVVVTWKSASATPTATPTPKPTVTPTVKPTVTPTVKTITCYKGKLRKTVKAKSPKCPSGWYVKKPTTKPTPTPTVKTSAVTSSDAVPTAPAVDAPLEDPTVDTAAASTATISGYTVTATARGLTPVTAITDAKSTTVRFEGLQSGRSYRFTVVANSEAGDSPKSLATNPIYVGKPEAKPNRDLPGAPTGLSASPGHNAARLTWAEPAVDGGSPILMYLIEVTPEVGVAEFSVQETGRKVNTFDFLGLNADVEYTFTVRALTAAGTSLASGTAKVTPTGQHIKLPNGPSGIRVKYNNGYLGIQWSLGTAAQTERYISGWRIDLIDAQTGQPVERLDVRASGQSAVDFGSAQIGRKYRVAMTAISRPIIGYTTTTETFTMSKTLAEGTLSTFDPNATNVFHTPGIEVVLKGLKVAQDITIEWAPKAGQEVSKYYISWQDFNNPTAPWSTRIGLANTVTKYSIKDLPKGVWMLRIENVTDDGIGIVKVRVEKTE